MTAGPSRARPDRLTARCSKLWNGLLETPGPVRHPGLGALIALLPIAIIVLVVADLRVGVPAAGDGARRPGAASSRIEPATPAGIHMPGPSFAPIFAAFGAFLLFLGLVFGGTILYPRGDRLRR